MDKIFQLLLALGFMAVMSLMMLSFLHAYFAQDNSFLKALLITLAPWILTAVLAVAFYLSFKAAMYGAEQLFLLLS